MTAAIFLQSSDAVITKMANQLIVEIFEMSLVTHTYKIIHGLLQPEKK